MAIVVQCYHCNAILELDEGFRGGVCRCSQCGSLLQVPKSSGQDGKKTRPAAPGASPTQVGGGGKRPGTPLEDAGLSRGQFDPRSPQVRRPSAPGEAGISSGAFSRPSGPSAATRPKIERAMPAPGEPVRAEQRAAGVRRNTALIIAAVSLAVVIGVVLVVVIVISAFKSTHDEGRMTGGEGGRGVSGEVKPAASGPNFFEVPLAGRQIVFSVDSASSATESFSHVLAGVEKAVGMLDDEQEFKIAFWAGDTVKVVPASGWAKKKDLGEVKKALDSAAAVGSSDATAAMKASLALKGDQTIFVTAKYGLGAEVAPPVLAAKASGQRVDAIKIGPRVAASESEGPGYPLREIAERSGGVFLRKDIGGLDEYLHKK